MGDMREDLRAVAARAAEAAAGDVGYEAVAQLAQTARDALEAARLAETGPGEIATMLETMRDELESSGVFDDVESGKLLPVEDVLRMVLLDLKTSRGRVARAQGAFQAFGMLRAFMVQEARRLGEPAAAGSEAARRQIARLESVLMQAEQHAAGGLEPVVDADVAEASGMDVISERTP